MSRSIVVVLSLAGFTTVLVAGSCSGGGGGGPARAPAEAEGVIDHLGGTVEVTDPASPLLGVSVTFLPDTVDPKGVSVSISLPRAPATPAGMTPNGPPVELLCDPVTEFQKDVAVKMAVASEPAPGQHLDVLRYDTAAKQWVRVHSWYSPEEKVVVFPTGHFSMYRCFTVGSPDSGSEAFSAFNAGTDSFEYNNRDGVCYGMSALAKWFFEKRGHGLRYYYNEATGRQVATECHDLVRRKVFKNLEFLYSFAREAVLDNGASRATIIRALKAGQPTILLMAVKTQEGPQGHAVLVYGWTPTGPDGEGHFTAYDPDDHDKVLKIEVFLGEVPVIGATYFKMAVDGEPWTYFCTYSDWALDVDAVMKRHAADNWGTAPSVLGKWDLKSDPGCDGKDLLENVIEFLEDHTFTSSGGSNGSWRVDRQQVWFAFDGSGEAYKGEIEASFNNMSGDIENSVAERTGCWSLARHVSGKKWWCYIRLKATGYSTNWLSEEEIKYPLFMWWEGPVTLVNGKYEGSWGEDDYAGTDGFAGTISVTVDDTNRVTHFSATKTEVWPECPPNGSVAKIEGPKAGTTIPFYKGSGYLASGAAACEAAPTVQYHDGCPGYEVTLRRVECPADGENELVIRFTELE